MPQKQRSDGFREQHLRRQDEALKKLHDACRKGRVDDVSAALKDEHCPGINAKDPECGWTALHYSATRGNADVMKVVLDLKGDVTCVDTPYCQTPLHIAAKYGHAEACRLLLLSGADSGAVSQQNRTPLQVASTESVKSVLRAGVDGKPGEGGGKTQVNLKGAKQGNFSSAGSGGWVKTGQFSGRIENGVMSGSGRLEYDDGTTFEGEWSAGKREGKGTLVAASGETYEGDWAADVRHGTGQLREADGGEYHGTWANDLRHGFGKQLWASGAKYEGEFYEGKMHGKGVLRSENGNMYQGDMYDGLRHGRGRVLYRDGGWYEGSFQRDRAHGEGLEQQPGCTESNVVYDFGSLVSRQPLSGCPQHYALVISIAYFEKRYKIPSSERMPRASALARVLRDPLLAGYPVENVTSLTDEEATKSAILKAFDRLRTSTSADSTIFIYFDGVAAEISAGPEAGYYLCPYDYDPTDRKGSGIECFTGYGKDARGKMIDLIGGLPAEKVLFCFSSQHPDALDSDVTYGSPFFREKFIERLQALPGRAIMCGCKMDEPAYTGIFNNLIFDSIAGVRDEDSDVDNQFYARIASDGNAMYTFNLMDYLRRHMHKKLPKEYVNDPRMHAQITLEQGDNFVVSRRSHPTRFPMEIEKRRAELGIKNVTFD